MFCYVKYTGQLLFTLDFWKMDKHKEGKAPDATP